MTPDLPSFYTTGGTLPPGSPSYVVREADTALYDGLAAGEFCYVLTSRQMGKSSLMIRTAERLREEGATVLVLDLTSVGQNLTAEQWYNGLLSQMGERLGLEDELDDFWSANKQWGPLQRWLTALDQVVLRERAGKLVLFIDEIDVVRSLPFPTDEFFAGIRECYNRRAQDPRWNRLTFCLLGVASPSDLIQDARMTPFNIGRRIELNDFTEAEAASLTDGLNHPSVRKGERQKKGLLQRILHWTGGHPYLTQRLFRTLAETAAAPLTPEAVDRACEALFLAHDARAKDDNLLFVRERILREEDRAGLLELYGRVRNGKRVSDDETLPSVRLLLLSGITRTVSGQLRVRNRIYEQVFDREWVRENMPDAELRRQQAAYRRGLLRAATVGGTVAVMLAGLSLTAMDATAEAHQSAKQASRDQRIALQKERQAKEDRKTAIEKAEEATRMTRRYRQTLIKLAVSVKEEEQARDQAERAAKQEKRARAEEQAMRLLAETSKTRAERGRAEALKQKSRAEEQRLYAQRQTREARLRTEEAKREREDRHLQLVRLNMDTGDRWMEEGDVQSALPWYAEALRLDIERPKEPLHRRRLAAALQASPRLARLWYAGDSLVDASFSPDGSRMALRLWQVAGITILNPMTGKRFLLKGEGTGHPHGVRFSGDGKRLFAATNHVGRVWDAVEEKPLSPPMEHPDAIVSAAYSPRGNYVATGSFIGGKPRQGIRLHVWDANSGKQIAAFPQTYPASTRLSFSPDERLLAISARSNEVEIKDARTLETLHRIQSVYPVAETTFHPDNKKILFTSQNRENGRDCFQVFDVASGKPLHAAIPHLRSSTRRPAIGRFNRDGTKLLISGLDYTQIWDWAGGLPISTPMPNGNQFKNAGFSPDERSILAATSGSARLWKTYAVGSLAPPLQHPEGLMDAAFLPDGRHIVTASSDGMIRVWACEPPPPLHTFAFPDESRYATGTFSPDGRRVLIRKEDRSLHLVESRTFEAVLPPMELNGLTHAVFSRDGSLVAAGSPGGSARVWETRTGKPVTPLLAEEKTSAPMTSSVDAPLAFSPDGLLLAVGSLERGCRLWDLKTGKLRSLLLPEGPIADLVFSKDGKILVVSSRGRVSAWNLRAGKEAYSHNVPNYSSDSKLSPDGEWLLVSMRGEVRLFSVSTGRQVGPPVKQNVQRIRVAFSPDSRKFLTYGQDRGLEGNKVLRIWDRQTLRPAAPPMKQSHNINAAVFSPDGQAIAVALGNGAVRVWDVATGRPITPYLSNPGAGGFAHSPAFSPDGSQLIHSNGDSLTLWPVIHRERSSQDILRLSQILSGGKIEPSIGFTSSTPEKLLGAWNEKQERSWSQ